MWITMQVLTWFLLCVTSMMLRWLVCSELVETWHILLFHPGFIAVAASRTKEMLQLEGSTLTFTLSDVKRAPQVSGKGWSGWGGTAYRGRPFISWHASIVLYWMFCLQVLAILQATYFWWFYICTIWIGTRKWMVVVSTQKEKIINHNIIFKDFKVKFLVE